MTLLNFSLETLLFLFHIYEMTLTWKRGFDELEEKPKSQKKNENRKTNQKDLSLFGNCT